MLFTWPRASGDWADELAPARDSIAHAARVVSQTQTVILIAADENAYESIQTHPALSLGNPKLRVHRAPNNDVWVRDYGPLTLLGNSQRQFLDCRFNGWAGKYPADKDDRVTHALIQSSLLGQGNYQRREYILEGGAIDGNGAGALLVTRCCLLACPRNANDSEAVWNQRFADDLGIQNVHWLDHGLLEGDDTDGHVDTLARFVAQDHIVYQGCEDPADCHYSSLQNLGRQLTGLRQINGGAYQVQALPLPQPQYDAHGRRLPAGYANFLIANNVVLVPQYNDPADAQALRIIGDCFPAREAVGIDCAPLIRQNGAIHCAAMQIAAI